MMVGAVLDSVSDVTCTSEKVATRLGAHYTGVQVTFPFEGHASVEIAIRRELPGTAGTVRWPGGGDDNDLVSARSNQFDPCL